MSGGLALGQWLSARVDPPPPPPPADIDARITRVRLRSPSEALLDYLRETHQPTAGLSAEEGAEEGYVFAARVSLRGNQGRRLPLRWSVINERSGQRLRGPTYNQTAVVFVPRGPRQSRTWLVWVPLPAEKGTYRLRVTLVDERRQPLDEKDSAPFRLTRGPAP
jgi:hypothetical protein